MGPTAQEARHLMSRSRRQSLNQEISMLGTILLIVLVLFLLGALPSWPHSANWGYYPSGGIGLLLIIVVVLLLMGRI
jgi:hypothetical protein